MLVNRFKQQGVTLVELVIGVAILGILAAIAAPSYTTFIANSQIRSTTESIRNGLQVARAEAVKRNLPVRFTLSTDNSWIVGCVTTTITCPADIQSKAANEGGSGTITVVGVGAITPTNPVTFNNLGSASQYDVIVDNSSISTANSKDLRVRVGVGGNVRVCDPNISVTTDTRYCAA
jgi:type IV fimbrial biogenesis protein FimT